MKKTLLSLIIWGVLLTPVSKLEAQKKKKNQSNSTPSTEKVLLRYNLAKGNTYKQTLQIDANMEIMGMVMPQKQELQTQTTIVEVASNGNQTHETTYERLYMKQSTPMGDMEYDSDKPSADNPMAELFKDIKGRKVYIVLTPRGKIIETKDSQNVPNNSSLINNNINIEYPEQSVGVGDSWTGEVTNKIEQVGEMKVKSNYKIVSIQNGIAEIEIKGKIYIDDKEQGEISGNSKVDTKTGLALESTIKQKLTMQAQGMEVKSDNTIKITTKI